MFALIYLMVRFSDLDLIKILFENARMPYVKIAERLGVTETAVRKRIARLEREKIIKGYTVQVDLRKLGFEIDALIGVDTKPEYFLHVLQRLKNMDEVISLYSSSGDHMILAECWFRNSEELTKFVEKLESMEGVTRVCPAILLEKVK